MVKKYHQKKYAFRFTRPAIISIVTIVAFSIGISAYSYNSLIPVNGSTAILAPPNNHFIKAKYDSKSGNFFVGMPTSRVKGTRTAGSGNILNPLLTFNKGYPQTIHIINEDSSAHNFNIDSFNVHSRDLGYFENQAITFLPDIDGTFEYYCTLHPEMKGNIIVK